MRTHLIFILLLVNSSTIFAMDQAAKNKEYERKLTQLTELESKKIKLMYLSHLKDLLIYLEFPN